MSIRYLVLTFLGAVAFLIGGLATAQDLVVDSTPSRVANEFSPVRSLGGTVDRIEERAADHALQQPMLNEILGAGWQVISYRQNT